MSEKRTRPRALTLTLPDIKQPSLVFGNQKYLLRNFSQEGIGLWMPTPPPFSIQKGATIRADIEIGKDIHPVQLEVVHASQKVLGLRIVHSSRELARIFRELLEPSAYACQLLPNPSSGSQDRQNGYRRLWYCGPGPSELVVWYGVPQGMIQALQLCFLGCWVFRELLKPAVTGHLRNPHPAPEGRLFTESELVPARSESEAESLQRATQFLAAVPDPLPGHLLWQFLETGEQVYLPPEIVGSSRVA